MLTSIYRLRRGPENVDKFRKARENRRSREKCEDRDALTSLLNSWAEKRQPPMPKEAKARILINDLLRRSRWRFFDDQPGLANIALEAHITLKKKTLDDLGNNFEKTANGFVDYLLLVEKGYSALPRQPPHGASSKTNMKNRESEETHEITC